MWLPMLLRFYAGAVNMKELGRRSESGGRVSLKNSSEFPSVPPSFSFWQSVPRCLPRKPPSCLPLLLLAFALRFPILLLQASDLSSDQQATTSGKLALVLEVDLQNKTLVGLLAYLAFRFGSFTLHAERGVQLL